MQLSPQQAAALAGCRTWLADPRGEQVKMLSGYAGTGKSTIAKLLAGEVSVRFVAPTGKAALVLETMGCVGATTIHALIYVPRERRSRDEALEFDLRGDDPLADVELVVADECSMIDSRTWADLLSFGRRVLVLGDPFQLPPVRGESPLANRAPDWLLTEVHRQARDSGILRLATDVREGRGICGTPRWYGDEVLVTTTGVAMERVAECVDQIIVGTNRSRHHFNAWARTRRGLADGREVPQMPLVNERVVCLRNERRRGLANGQVWRTSADARSPAGGWEIDVRDEAGLQLASVPVHPHHFVGRGKDLDDVPWRFRKLRCEFDYAYAITGHKSQGSQWDGVCVVDESYVFGEEAARWVYTCATRARLRLIVVK